MAAPARAQGADVARRQAPPPAAQLTTLTEREREVLHLLVEGKRGRAIADVLVLRPATVERHRANVMAKLGLHSRADLIKYALRRRLIQVEGERGAAPPPRRGRTIIAQPTSTVLPPRGNGGMPPAEMVPVPDAPLPAVGHAVLVVRCESAPTPRG